VSYFLMKASNVPIRKNKMKGASNPGKEFVGEVTLKHVYEIAKIKLTVGPKALLLKKGKGLN